MSSKLSAKSAISDRRLQALARVSYICLLILVCLFGAEFVYSMTNYNAWNNSDQTQFFGLITIADFLVMIVLVFFNAAALMKLIRADHTRLTFQSKIAVALMSVEVIFTAGVVLLFILPLLLNFGLFIQDLRQIFYGLTV